MKSYRVTAQPKRMGSYDYPAEFDIDAENKKEAIKQAREMVRKDMIWDRHDGPINYTAEVIE